MRTLMDATKATNVQPQPPINIEMNLPEMAPVINVPEPKPPQRKVVSHTVDANGDDAIQIEARCMS